MNLKQCLLIVLICSSINSFGFDYFEYYLNTSKAELCLLDSNFAEALQYYEQAFNYADIPWATDYHNACLASIFCEKFEKTYNYLDCLLKKGLRENYFIKNYNVLLNKQTRWKQFKKDLPSNINAVLETKRVDIQQELIHRADKDNYYRKKMNYEHEYLDSFYNTLIDNMGYYLQIEKEQGMCNENSLGIIDLPGLAFNAVILVHSIQQQIFCKYPSDSVPEGYKRDFKRFEVGQSYCSNNDTINYPLISVLRRNVQTGKIPLILLMNMYVWLLNSPDVDMFYSKFSDEGKFEWVFSKQKDMVLMNYYKKIKEKSFKISGILERKIVIGWNKFEYPENFLKRNL